MNIFSLYKLRMSVLFRNAILIIPIVATVVFLGTMYSMPPFQVSGSFLLSGLFLFVISLYISVCIQDRENDVHEEVMLLHSRSFINYYISRELVLLSCMLVFAAILTIFPGIKYMNDSTNFSRPLVPLDTLYGGMIILINGLCGISVGDLFHQRIISRRRDRLIAVIFVSVVAVCKHSLIHSFVFLKFLNIFLPPIMDGFDMVGNTDIFDEMGTIKILIHTLIFAAVVTLIKIKILLYKKYNS